MVLVVVLAGAQVCVCDALLEDGHGPFVKAGFAGVVPGEGEAMGNEQVQIRRAPITLPGQPIM